MLADLTGNERPGTSYQIAIHCLAFNLLYYLFSSIKLVETELSYLVEKIMSQLEIWK